MRSTTHRRRARRAVTVLAFMLLAPTGARAQSASGELSVGLDAGVGTISRAFLPKCSNAEGRTSAASLGGWVGARYRRLVVQAHASLRAQDLGRGWACLLVPRTYPDGIHEERHSRATGSDGSTDLRVGFALGGEPRIQLLIGAGRTWSAGVLHGLAAVELSGGTWVRWLLAAEAIAWRVPWDLVTMEWRDHELVREHSRVRSHEWSMSPALRLGVELPVVRW